MEIGLYIFFIIFHHFNYVNARLDIKQIDGKYNQIQTFTFKKGTEYLIVYPTSQSVYPYRIRAWSERATTQYPVLLVVKQERSVLSWQVPTVVETSKKDLKLQFHNTSKTLCHNNMDEIARQNSVFLSKTLLRHIQQSFVISLSTSSLTEIDLHVKIEEEYNFYIKTDFSYTVVVSPSEPRYSYYKLDDTSSDTVVVEMHSDDDVCFVVSVQDPWCPVFESEEDITYRGKYQTLNKKGAISIMKKDFSPGFFLVFVVKADNYDCSQEKSLLPMPRQSYILPSNRSSIISFKIRNGINRKDYLKASLGTICFIIIFYVISLTMAWLFGRFGVLTQMKNAENPEYPLDPLEPLTDNEIELYLERKQLNVKSLAKYPLKDKKRSFNYLWHILTIAIFYSIPVVQLVITYQRVVNQTGNQDMCYYNFLCAHPGWGLTDFNHVFSNIGYFFAGILFLIVVLYRHAVIPFRHSKGIPVHYGLFYAMSVALIIEGLLSACYHICPSQSNYQFDTSFMYIMAVLCMVKLYQNRHPDINATAYATFTVLGLAIFLAVIGILNGNLAVWIVFVIMYSILCIYISFKIYFLSYVFEGMKRFREIIVNDGCHPETFRPNKRNRFIILIVVNLLNMTMLVTGLCLYDNGSTDFATFLLALLMGNSVVHAFFYTAMKINNHETICWEARCYGILMVVIWVIAGYFFLDYSVLWTLTPAESRERNQDCILMDFYDKHDVWHLLGAPALYYTFMFLLCLDDDLLDTRQEDIVVF